MKIQHARDCGVRTKTLKDCTCGLQNRNVFVQNLPNHKNACPCHCSCDFAQRLQHHLYAGAV